MRKGAVPTIIALGLGVLLFIIVAVLAVQWIPALGDVLASILGKSRVGWFDKSEALEEGIQCAYYRCKEGCSYVNSMTWKYIKDYNQPTERKFYCCYDNSAKTSMWKSRPDGVCGTPPEVRMKPSACESGGGLTCKQMCEHVHYKSSSITGSDETGYCLCKDIGNSCPCTYVLGKEKICGDDAKTHPVEVRLGEDSTLSTFDIFKYIMLTDACSPKGYDLDTPIINIEKTLTIKQSEESCDGWANVKQQQNPVSGMIRYATRCDIAGGTYWIYTEHYRSVSLYDWQVVLCSKKSCQCNADNTGCADSKCQGCAKCGNTKSSPVCYNGDWKTILTNPEYPKYGSCCDSDDCAQNMCILEGSKWIYVSSLQGCENTACKYYQEKTCRHSCDPNYGCDV